MKYPNFTKQNHRHPAAISFTNLSPKLGKQCLNVAPLDICAYRAGEYRFQGFLVLPFHGKWYHIWVPCKASRGKSVRWIKSALSS